MAPKRSSGSARQKLTKKQIEEQQAELEAAARVAAEAAAARELAARLAAEERAREEEAMIVRERIDVPRHSDADTRAVLLKSFGHLFATATQSIAPPQSPPPALPPLAPVSSSEPEPTAAAAAAVATTTASALATPVTSRPGTSASDSGRKLTSAHGKKTPSSSPRPPTSAKKTSEEKELERLAKEEARFHRAEQKKLAIAAEKAAKIEASALRKASAPSSGATTKRLTKAEQQALDELAAAEAQRQAEEAAAAAEYARLHPRFSPETEARLESLSTSVEEKYAYTAAAEADILAHYDAQEASNLAEGDRLVNDFRLIPGVDIPDEQRRLKETPLTIQSQAEYQQAAAAAAASPPSTGAPSARTLPPRTDRQVLSASGLIDLQSILDRQKARQEAVNKAIKYRDPVSDTVKQHRRRPSRKAALETGSTRHPDAEAEGDGHSPTHTSHASSQRIQLVKALMPVGEIHANKAILEHMQTLQNFPRNPRYDERNARQGGPGGKGLNASVKKQREEAKQSTDELADDLARTLDLATTNLSPEDLASAKSSCLQVSPSIAWFRTSVERRRASRDGS